MPPGPLVSVIVCVYNGERGIARILASLTAQSYTNIEIIVVDDGSTDRSAEIVRTFAAQDGRIRLIQHMRNLRLAAGRNTGVRHAHGTIICFTDDDCRAHADWIAELVRVYEARPEVGGVGGRIEADAPTSLLEKYARFGKNRVYDHTPATSLSGRLPLYLQKFFGWRRVDLKDGHRLESIMGMNCSYRRETLELIREFDATLEKGEDWDANLRALKQRERVFDATLTRGVDWELNLRLQKQERPLFVYCDRAIIYHKNRQALRPFLQHLYAYGQAYTDVARRHPDIRLLPYPAPVLFILALLLGLLDRYHWLIVIPAALYTKDLPFIIGSFRVHRDWSLFLFPFIDLLRESSYNLGLLSRAIRRT